MRISRVTPSSLVPMSDRGAADGDILTLNAFCDRLAAAAPGETLTYYVGMLAHDCGAMSLVLPEPRRLELCAIASRALQLAEAGRVHLLQRRLGPERFAYLAVVRPQPRRIGREMAAPIFGRALAEAA